MIFRLSSQKNVVIIRLGRFVNTQYSCVVFTIVTFLSHSTLVPSIKLKVSSLNNRIV